MNVVIQKIDCGHASHKYKNSLLLSFENADDLLQKSLSEGKQRAKGVNSAGPDGMMRDLLVIESANIRGVLAEFCTENILSRENKKRGSPAKIEMGSDKFINTSEGITQIDLYFTMNGKKYTIETRSSCVRNGIEFGIKSGYFNIVGWYKTTSKINEPEKDFYFMYLYGFDSSETTTYFGKKVDVCFVGGATKSMLKGSLGSDIAMKQTGATYRGIKPICAGFDYQQIVDELFK